MEHYTIMLVVDARSPVKRFQIAKATVRKALIGVGVAVAILAGGLWDYVRVRADNSELGSLRVEVAEQREQIDSFEKTLLAAENQLDEVRELERKVRIIANLPGAAGVGGEEVTELVPAFDASKEEEGDMEVMPPAGVPVDRGPVGQNFPETGMGGPEDPLGPEGQAREGLTSLGARHISNLADTAGQVAARAGGRTESLGLLVKALEDKRTRLVSMPSVWPAKGWLTSRFGARISPFTGRRQMHAGIDIAAREGTLITSPARGRVASIDHRGPLGNSLTIDHGFGVKTFYGHTKEIYVKVGDTVDRGQKIAAIGSTGRSTGPHLHYAIHVNGKSRDPLDYIFD
jgi:murein DD-endopeptidase MepM/ murein hydrolase activator NlpD